MHPTLRDLIELSAKRKWMSYEELNTTLPDEMVDPEKLDELIVLLRRLGVEMIDQETVRRNSLQTFQAPLQTNLKFKRDDPRKAERKPTAGAEPSSQEEADERAADAAALAAASGSADPAEDILDDAETQAAIQEAIA